MKKLLFLVMMLFVLGSCEVTNHGVRTSGRIEIGVDDNYYNNRYYSGYYPNQGYRYHNTQTNTYFFRPSAHDNRNGMKQKNQRNKKR
jgi:hypothetical protein